MVTEGWTEIPILSILKDKIKIGPFGSQLKKELLVSNGPYKVYGQENVYARNFSIGERTLTEEHFKKLQTCEIKPGDFLMSTMGTIGKCAIVPNKIHKGIMDSHLIRFRIDDTKVLSEYLLQLYSDDHSYLKQQTSKLSVGGIMDGLSVGIASKLNVLIPMNLDEQRNIVSALSDIDHLIFDLEKLVKKKKAMREGAVQSLITGCKRLPGFTGEWEEINLSKKSKIKARIGWQGLKKAEYLDSGYSFLITGTDFVDGYIDWHGCHFVTKDRYDQDTNIQVTNGDVLLTKDGTIGKVALVDGLTKPATLNSGVFVIRPINNSYSARFLYYVLSSSVFRTFLDELAAGSTIVHLYQKDLVKFDFYIPPTIEEQEAIATVIYDMEAEIIRLQAKLEKYRKIKSGMMDELLTGKVRLV